MMTYEEQQLEALQEAYSDLEREHQALKAINEENDEIYDDLLVEHKDLQEEHEELKEEYASLFDDLLIENKDLQAAHEELKAEFHKVLDLLDGNSDYDAYSDVDEDLLNKIGRDGYLSIIDSSY